MKMKRDKKDTVFSDLVRLRANYICESCGHNEGGKSQAIQCAHIISRKYKLVRYHPDNAFCLCASCHMNFTDHPLLFADFVREKQGDELPDIIREIAYSKRKIIKLEYEDMYKDYRRQLKEMQLLRDNGVCGRLEFIYPL
jgi:hypothetical protein